MTLLSLFLPLLHKAQDIRELKQINSQNMSSSLLQMAYARMCEFQLLLFSDGSKEAFKFLLENGFPPLHLVLYGGCWPSAFEQAIKRY